MRTSTRLWLSICTLGIGLLSAFVSANRGAVVSATEVAEPAIQVGTSGARTEKAKVEVELEGLVTGNRTGNRTETETETGEGPGSLDGKGVVRLWESSARMLQSKSPEGCPEWTENASSCSPIDMDPPRPPRIPLSNGVLDAALEGCAEAGGVKIEAKASWIRVPDCRMAWNARAVATPAPAPIYRSNPIESEPPNLLDSQECLIAQEAEGLRIFLLPPADPEGDPADGNIAGVADFRLTCCEDCGGEAAGER